MYVGIAALLFIAPSCSSSRPISCSTCSTIRFSRRRRGARHLAARFHRRRTVSAVQTTNVGASAHRRAVPDRRIIASIKEIVVLSVKAAENTVSGRSFRTSCGRSVCMVLVVLSLPLGTTASLLRRKNARPGRGSTTRMTTLAAWFLSPTTRQRQLRSTAVARGGVAYTVGNDVTVLVHGRSYYRRLLATLRTCRLAATPPHRLASAIRRAVGRAWHRGGGLLADLARRGSMFGVWSGSRIRTRPTSASRRTCISWRPS